MSPALAWHALPLACKTFFRPCSFGFCFSITAWRSMASEIITGFCSRSFKQARRLSRYVCSRLCKVRCISFTALPARQYAALVKTCGAIDGWRSYLRSRRRSTGYRGCRRSCTSDFASSALKRVLLLRATISPIFLFLYVHVCVCRGC
jgi:hypothetical protein